MIRITDKLWIGDSSDEAGADLSFVKADAILNVAHDLEPTRGWNKGILYTHVGLLDGPGNPLGIYYSALWALNVLIERNTCLVVCHTGTRSLAIAIMYLNLKFQRTWDEWIKLLRERIDITLPEPNAAHVQAFNSINWKLLKTFMEPK